MARRVCFLAQLNNVPAYQEIEMEFQYYSGFSVSQKQKSIKSLHENIRSLNEGIRVLEVSTKSPDSIGVELSAFNLHFYDENTGKEYPLENVFQSSKVFEHGGPYRDLLDVHPRDAKRDERLKTSGELIRFCYQGDDWALEPKSMFYDWIYMQALRRNSRLAKAVLEYNAFTDIEFNHKKSNNCQARAAAIFVSLSKIGILEKTLKNKEELRNIYPREKRGQISIFE